MYIIRCSRLHKTKILNELVTYTNMKLIVSLVVICQLGLALSQEDGARGGGDLSEFSKYKNYLIIISLSKE